MFSKLTKYYNQRNKRERLMMWAMLVVGLCIWISSLTTGYSEVNTKISDTQTQKKLAELAIANAPLVQAQLDKILATFDTSKTLSPVDLQIAVESCAKRAYLNYSLSSVKSNDAGRFVINTITLSCQKSDLRTISSFEILMRALEPYVMFTSATFNGGKQGELSAKYNISSFEIRK